jgi:hypothetical protein
MGLHDPETEGKAQSRPLSRRFRREKRLEDFRSGERIDPPGKRQNASPVVTESKHTCYERAIGW